MDEEDQYFSFSSPRPQQFPFRKSYIDYMIKYATPKAWSNMLMSCKFFYFKQPLIPIQTWRGCKTIRFRWINTKYYGGVGLLKDDHLFWFSGHFSINGFIMRGYKRFIAGYVANHRGRHEFSSIYFCNQILSINDFKKLTASQTIQRCVLYHVGIYRFEVDPDTFFETENILVPFEEVAKCVKNVTTFEYVFSYQPDKNPTVFPEMKVIANFPNLKQLSLQQLTDKFDFKAFVAFLKAKPFVTCEISFAVISSEHYRVMLQNYVYQILAAPKDFMPLIEFPGHDEEAFSKLQLAHKNQLLFLFQLL